jgi:hypothetical protein
MASVVIDLIAKVQEKMTLYGHMAFSLEYTYFPMGDEWVQTAGNIDIKLAWYPCHR